MKSENNNKAIHKILAGMEEMNVMTDGLMTQMVDVFNQNVDEESTTIFAWAKDFQPSFMTRVTSRKHLLDFSDARWANDLKQEYIIPSRNDQVAFVAALEVIFKQLREQRLEPRGKDVALVYVETAATLAGVTREEIDAAINRGELRRRPLYFSKTKRFVRIDDLAAWVIRNMP